MTLAWKFLISFLIGSIPFAKIAMLGTGIDITNVGSKNPGFLNVSRVASRWRAAICLIGDLSKGYLALLLLARGEMPASWPWIIGIAAVMGHCWSPFLGFDGGKGVATTFGVLLFLDPHITLVCLPLYPALRFFGSKRGWKQKGAIASIATAFLITVLVMVLRGIQPGIFACFMFAIILVRHTPNIREIRAPESARSPGGSKSQAADIQAAPRQSR
jgi:glycerol-3-phosphate acyltransferase PlsY